MKIFNGRVIARPTWDRAHEENLIKRHFGVVQMPAGKTVVLLQVVGRQNLPMKDQVLKTGRVLLYQIDYSVAKLLTLLIPMGASQLIRRVLHPYRHDVFP